MKFSRNEYRRHACNVRGALDNREPILVIGSHQMRVPRRDYCAAAVSRVEKALEGSPAAAGNDLRLVLELARCAVWGAENWESIELTASPLSASVEDGEDG